MHITVTATGTIEVHGSRRVAAHLHGRELEHVDAREATVAALVASRLVTADEAPQLLALVREVDARDLPGWQIAVAALRDPAGLRALRRRRLAAELAGTRTIAVRVRLGFPETTEEHVHVYVRVCCEGIR